VPVLVAVPEPEPEPEPAETVVVGRVAVGRVVVDGAAATVETGSPDVEVVTGTALGAVTVGLGDPVAGGAETACDGLGRALSETRGAGKRRDRRPRRRTRVCSRVRTVSAGGLAATPPAVRCESAAAGALGVGDAVSDAVAAAAAA
jgi:hypothetical protein